MPQLLNALQKRQTKHLYII